MSYIRTKDGKIYQLIGGPNKDGEYQYLDRDGNPALTKDVVEQADDIVDLCDGFYIDDHTYKICSGGLFSKDGYEGFDLTIEDYKAFNISFVAYGVIRTQYGLTFVAEMDYEGNWKLL